MFHGRVLISVYREEERNAGSDQMLVEDLR